MYNPSSWSSCDDTLLGSARSAMWSLFALGLVTSILMSSVQAHPHMFMDATARLQFDSDGRLTHVRSAFVVDEYNSLLTVADLELDQEEDGILTPAEEQKVLDRVYEGFAPYDFYVDLRLGRSHTDPEIKMGPPSGGAVKLQNDQLAITLEVPLIEPLTTTGKTLSLALYDPTFFTAIRTIVAPTFVGPSTCEVTLVPYEETAETRELASWLSMLGPQESSGNENLGIYLADETVITCP